MAQSRPGVSRCGDAATTSQGPQRFGFIGTDQLGYNYWSAQRNSVGRHNENKYYPCVSKLNGSHLFLPYDIVAINLPFSRNDQRGPSPAAGTFKREFSRWFIAFAL